MDKIAQSFTLFRQNQKKSQLWQRFGLPLASLMIALIFSGFVIFLVGKNPFYAIPSIFTGAFGSQNAFAEVLVKTAPLLLAGLGTAFAFRCKIWNIGAEGQILMGALAASIVALNAPTMPSFIFIPIIAVVAFVAGGVWGGIAGYLKAKLGASEIINTIMLNYVAIYLIDYLVHGPLKDPEGYVPHSSIFPVGAWLTRILPPTRLHIGILFAIVAIVISYMILGRTSLGFKIIATGSNSRAALVGGISVFRTVIVTMFISGGLCGLAGAWEVTGLYHRMLGGVSAGYGFSAMAVAILGNLNPIGISIFAFFLATLRVGADHMQRQFGVPVAVVFLIEGAVIIFIQGRDILATLLNRIIPGEKHPTSFQEES